MALTIDPEQETRVRKTVARTGGESPEAFVRAAVEQALLESMLLHGLHSGDPAEGTREYWHAKRERFMARHPERQ
jgi:hypothetical protein